MSSTRRLRAAFGSQKVPNQSPPPYDEKSSHQAPSPQAEKSSFQSAPFAEAPSPPKESQVVSQVHPPSTDEFKVKLHNSDHSFAFSRNNLLKYNCRKFYDLSITYLDQGDGFPIKLPLGRIKP